jgi:hypothetical protein
MLSSDAFTHSVNYQVIQSIVRSEIDRVQTAFNELRIHPEITELRNLISSLDKLITTVDSEYRRDQLLGWRHQSYRSLQEGATILRFIKDQLYADWIKESRHPHSGCVIIGETPWADSFSFERDRSSELHVFSYQCVFTADIKPESHSRIELRHLQSEAYYVSFSEIHRRLIEKDPSRWPLPMLYADSYDDFPFESIIFAAMDRVRELVAAACTL